MKFNVEKTKAVLFTRKYKFTEPTITLDGKNIEFVSSFKYLGVIFDKKLKWNEHVKVQAKKAKAALMIGRRMVGHNWGLNPKTTHWLYTAIVRPVLTYGSVVWTTSLEKKGNNNILTKVQRLACKMITGCMHSTPTAGMEILLGLKPIELELEAASLMTSIRLERSKHWINEGILTKSHVNRLDEMKEGMPELQYPQDKSIKKVRMKNSFETVIGSRKEYAKKLIKPRPLGGLDVNCFTDGSKTDNGAGAAYIMMGNDDDWRIFKRQEFIHLGQSVTVIQAEITAIA